MQKADERQVTNAGDETRARLAIIRAALRAKQINPDDARSGAELKADLYDEDGLPK